MLTTPPQTDAEFRAVIAYHDLKLYRLAADIGLHPARLSLALHGRAPLHRDLADRLWRAIQEAAAK
jgi:plasmid maintenance system antidote protein VapI